LGRTNLSPNVCSLSGNGHDRSGTREIVLDILFFLCSYNEAGIASLKPSQKRGAEPQKSRFRVKTVKTQVDEQMAGFVWKSYNPVCIVDLCSPVARQAQDRLARFYEDFEETELARTSTGLASLSCHRFHKRQKEPVMPSLFVSFFLLLFYETNGGT
jgi:hypothetical protein